MKEINGKTRKLQFCLSRKLVTDKVENTMIKKRFQMKLTHSSNSTYRIRKCDSLHFQLMNLTLKLSKISSYDEINFKVIKSCYGVLHEPNALKIARVSPLFKSRDNLVSTAICFIKKSLFCLPLLL